MLHHINNNCTSLLTFLNRCVGVSDQLQLFAKEQERNKLLCSSAPQTSHTAPSSPTIPSTSHQNSKTPAATKRRRAGKGNKNVEEAQPMCGDITVDTADEGLEKEGRKSRRERTQQSQSEIPVLHPTPTECRYPSLKWTLESHILTLTVLSNNQCLFDNLFSHHSHHSGETPTCSSISMTSTPDPVPTHKAGNLLKWTKNNIASATFQQQLPNPTGTCSLSCRSHDKC